MSNTIVSANMSLTIPNVGVDPGPDYALNVNASLAILDSHNHTLGNGVQITPSGLNINTDLPFLGNSATQLLSVNFNSQSLALTGNNFLSFVSGNLFVNDGSGNQIQMTASGGIAGTPGSIGSLTPPAAANYSAGSKTFIWTSGSSKAAAMDNGAVTIRETDVASANGITLASPTSLVANYQLTLPATLPISNQYMTSSSGGALSFSTADQIGSAMTSVGADAVANTRTRAFTTPASLGDVAVSASSGIFSTTSNNPTFVDITNLSVSLVVSGLRPVYIGLIAEGGISSQIGTAGTNNPNYVDIKMLRGATIIGFWEFTSTGTAGDGLIIPPGCINVIEKPVAGTYTYKVQMATNGSVVGNTTGICNHAKLVAYEL